MIKTLIAEDDPAMRLVLKRILDGIAGTEVIGEAENGKQLVQMVEELTPDVVFVDVDMPEMNGVEAAREIFDINPKIFIVFATAYDNYTHEAFQVYSFDYLIKPFKLERIHYTMQRISELKTVREKVHFQQISVNTVEQKNLKLILHSNEKSTYINIQDIILITRYERKSVLFTMQGNFTSYEPLQKLEERLKGCNFFRCHKGYIINTDMVIEVSPWGNKTYLIKMANTKETALMTLEKAKQFNKMFCL